MNLPSSIILELNNKSITIELNNKHGKIKCDTCMYRNEWVYGYHELWTTCKLFNDGRVCSKLSWCAAGCENITKEE